MRKGAAAMHVISSDEPPALINGSVVPFDGIMPIATPIFITAWDVIASVNPTAMNL